jgi:hypothetical protein
VGELREIVVEVEEEKVGINGSFCKHDLEIAKL